MKTEWLSIAPTKKETTFCYTSHHCIMRHHEYVHPPKKNWHTVDRQKNSDIRPESVPWERKTCHMRHIIPKNRWPSIFEIRSLCLMVRWWILHLGFSVQVRTVLCLGSAFCQSCTGGVTIWSMIHDASAKVSPDTNLCPQVSFQLLILSIILMHKMLQLQQAKLDNWLTWHEITRVLDIQTSSEKKSRRKSHININDGLNKTAMTIFHLLFLERFNDFRNLAPTKTTFANSWNNKPKSGRVFGLSSRHSCSLTWQWLLKEE